MPFRQIDSIPARDRLYIAAWGPGKVGKTTFALSFPSPRYYFNFNWGVAPLLTAENSAGLYQADYVVSPEFDYAEYSATLNTFEADWRDACASASAQGGSLLLDTGDELWNLARKVRVEKAKHDRIAKYGAKADRDDQRDYGDAHPWMDALLKRPHQHPRVNTCLIQEAYEPYVDNKPSGRLEMHGWKNTQYVTEVVLRMSTTAAKGVSGQIEYTRFGQGYRGLTIDSPTYAKLAAILS